MTPQLFINYKMKSVSHLPWRVFIYKALNTFIDDLFAFIITMPTMHRISVFRDDLVFFIYLYQRYIYPVDKTRAYEGMDDEEPPTTEAQDPSKASDVSNVDTTSTSCGAVEHMMTSNCNAPGLSPTPETVHAKMD